MFCQEAYEKTRRDVIQLLIADDGLSKDDVSMLRSLADSNDPKFILDLAKEMKDEGNMFFKKGSIDEALDKYGFAGLVVTCYVFGEDNRIEFFELVTSILLNFAACFLKKNAFEYVCLICSLILDFNPDHTKALFRRAVAAIELGRKDLALWDLLLALKIEPSNKEISDKLNQIKCIASRNTHEHQETPIGLGLGVPPMKKKKDSCSIQIVKEDVGVDSSEGGEICSPKDVKTKKEEECKDNQKDVVMEECDSGVESDQDEVNRPLNPTDRDVAFREANEAHGDVVEDASKYSTVEKPYPIESEIRFVNRRKADTYLSLRQETYQTLRVGKSLQYANSKSGSYMTIRMMSRSMGSSKNNAKVRVKDMMEVTDSNISAQEKLAEEQMKEEVNSSIQEVMGIDKPEHKRLEDNEDKDDSPSNMEVQGNDPTGHLNSTKRDSFFMSMKERRSKMAIRRKMNRPLTLYGARTREARKRNDYAGSTNLCVCRYPAGRKRRLVIPLAEMCSGQRKKFPRNVCLDVASIEVGHASSSSSCRSCFESKSYRTANPCCIISYFTPVSLPSHEMVNGNGG